VAIGFYKRAIELESANVEALGNQARLLEDSGDLKTAVSLLQRGLKLDPNDKVLALLLRDAELKLALAQDQAARPKSPTWRRLWSRGAAGSCKVG